MDSEDHREKTEVAQGSSASRTWWIEALETPDTEQGQRAIVEPIGGNQQKIRVIGLELVKVRIVSNRDG